MGNNSGEDRVWVGPWRVGMIVINGGAETPLQEVMTATVSWEEGVEVVNPFWNWVDDWVCKD